MTPELRKHLKPDELEAWERAEAATPGPWAWTPIGEKVNGYVIGPCENMVGERLEGHQEFDTFDDDTGAIVENIGECGPAVLEHEAATCNYGDADFITHARTDLPTALERLAEARAEAAHYCELLVKLEKTP